jgi:hypothetical protein
LAKEKKPQKILNGQGKKTSAAKNQQIFKFMHTKIIQKLQFLLSTPQKK